MVADREGDIYEIFEEADKAKQDGRSAEWLIRASSDRAVNDGKKRGKEFGYTYPKLFDEVLKQAPLGKVRFELKGQAGRKAREVEQTIYAAKVQLRPPARPDKRLHPQKIWVLLAQEETPPLGEDPLSWILISSMPIRSLDRAAQLIQWYLCRWEIEVFFRVLKTGCKVEKLQLTKSSHLYPCLAIYLIIAWRVLFVTMLGRECPELPCHVVFDDCEWKAAYLVKFGKPPPQQPPPLNEMIKLIASFGGYLNRKNDPPPGPTHLWIGIRRTRDFSIGILAAQGVDPLPI
jgi:hypothetical protein